MSDFVETMHAAQRIWDQMKADGASFAERTHALAATLRLVWPQGAHRDDCSCEWCARCPQCDGYGAKVQSCDGDATCGRRKRHAPHEYLQPCWCEKGRRFQPKPASAAEDELAQVGKTKKPRGFTKWGA